MNECLPDYVGFVFASSKRQVSMSTAVRIAERLDEKICRVGVFVGASPDEIAQTVATVGLGVVQLHFDTAPDYLLRLQHALRDAPEVRVWQRIAVPLDARSASDVLNRTDKYPPVERFDALLFDVTTQQSDGGSGVSFPWTVGKEAVAILRKKNPNIIVAGGIGVHNVHEAIDHFSPYAIDVSGSVETDGYKDREKVTALIRAVRERPNNND
ncbi:MAG: phosphoribosylanthranilate isomerase [Clostridiales bacterium]|nr:phosphoribosylanthranilate isomerase [Clostridiales bacterium]